MATSKSAKIQAEIEKVKAKLAEQQARLKELEQKKLEAENTEIVDIVRGLSISLDELPVLLQAMEPLRVLAQGKLHLFRTRNHHFLRRIPLNAEGLPPDHNLSVSCPNSNQGICIEQEPSVIFYIHLAASHKAYKGVPKDHVPWQPQGGNRRPL